MELENQILKVIEAQLPEQTAGLLRTYLNETKGIQEALKQERLNYEQLKKKTDLLESRLNIANSELEAFKNREKSLEEREAASKKAEIVREVAMLKVELEAQKTINNQIYQLVDRVFRNPTFVKHGKGLVPVMHESPSQYGTNQWSEMRQVDMTTTETQE